MIKNNIGKELSFETKLIIAKEKIKKTSKSLNSIIAYKKDWSHFEKWCVNNKQNLIPTEIDSVILYLTELADGKHGSLKTSTILRRISAIIYMNKENGHSFDLKNIGIQNSIDYVKTTLGEEQDRTPALLIEDLEKIVKEIDKEIIKNSNRLINYRDKAILLISWHQF